jgi:dihydroorotate dehydrogenase (fumarate)
MMDFLKTKFAGLNLPNPIIIASSGLTGTAEKNKELEKAGAGAIILQSIFEEQIEIQTETPLQPLLPETNVVCKDMQKSLKIADYLKLIQDTKKRCHIPVIASVICHKVGNWINFVRQIEMAGADAIELNIFALCTENKGYGNFLEQLYLQITEKVKSLISIPVIIKISKYFSHIVQLSADLHSAGADGIVLFSRFYQPDIDINRLQIHCGDVFSSSTDIADTLRWTPIVSNKLPEMSIASCTGIHDWEGVVKCILSGASAVEICSAVYQHGNEIISVMKRGLEEWMNVMNFHSIDTFRSKLNTVCLTDPSLHERTQFRKYFSDRD